MAGRLAPAAVAGIVLLAALGLWNTLLGREQARVRDTLALRAEATAEQLRSEIIDRANALTRMAARRANRPEMTEAEWSADAHLYVAHSAGIQAIGWVDASGVVRWVAPVEGNEVARGMYGAVDARRRMALDAARATGSTTMTRVVELAQGGKGFLIYAPVATAGTSGGSIAGVFRTESLFGVLTERVRASDEVAVAIFDGDDEIYRVGAIDPAEFSSRDVVETTIALYGVTWRLRVAPTEHLLAEATSPLPELVLGAGGLLACLLAIAIDLAQRARAHTSDALRARRALEASEERYRTMFDRSPIGIYRTLPDGRIIAANAALCAMLGTTLETLLGHDLEADGSHADYPRQVFRDVLDQRGRISGLESKWTRADGVVVFVRENAEVVRADDGTVVCYEGTVEDISERKRTEAALTSSEEVNRCVIESSGDAMFILDLDARIVSTSEKARELALRASTNDIEVVDWARLWDGDARIAAERAVEEARLGRVGRFEGSCSTSSSHSTWWDVSVSPIVGDAGVPERLLAVSRDISERRAAECELVERRRFAESVAEQSTSFIYVFDVATRLTDYGNRNILEFLGYELEETRELGAEFLPRVVHPDDLDWMIGRVEAYTRMADGEVFEFEARMRRASGEYRWLWFRESVYERDPHGSPLRVMGTAQDVTERKRMEEALRASNATLTALVEASPLAIIVLGRDGRVTMWNRAAESLFGWTRDEIHGQSIATLAPSPRGGELATLLNALDDGRPVVEFETVRIHKDGRPIDVNVSAAALRDRDGGFQGVVGVIADITERVRGREAIHAAREAAEAATRAKSAFLATMSHEIRTPMNAIIGLTDMLLDTTLDGEQHEFAEMVASSGRALLSLIDDILDFSKIESGHLELERAPMDVRECLYEALTLLSMKAAHQGLDLVCHVDDAVPAEIVGDVLRLRQIVLNLVGNAIKFTRAGDVLVSCSARRLDDARTEVEVAVRDTGIGIPADRIDRLFQAFSQVDASTTRNYGGTGLGLAISRRLAELMGGRMWAESELGLGSTFSFTLVAEAHPGPARPGEQTPAVLREKRVLLVDDNATVRRVLTNALAAWGMHTQPATSPREALTLLRAGRPFDVVLVDLTLPEMDGLALADEIHRLPGRADLPTLLLAPVGRLVAHSGPGHVRSVLTKPIRTDRMREALESALARERMSNAQPGDRPPRDAGSAEPRPLRILLAEDDSVNQMVGLRMLEQLGYRADLAATGVDVLTAVSRAAYDVILMDVQMPEMDGFEATRRIRSTRGHERWPRIVALTAYAMLGDRDRCLDAGMDDYLSKPVVAQELRAALERAADARSRV